MCIHYYTLYIIHTTTTIYRPINNTFFENPESDLKDRHEMETNLYIYMKKPYVYAMHAHFLDSDSKKGRLVFSNFFKVLQ